jgi:Icc protein
LGDGDGGRGIAIGLGVIRIIKVFLSEFLVEIGMMPSFDHFLSIAQITDIHLTDDPQQLVMGVNTDLSYRAVLELVRDLRPAPDLLLLTGDLTQDGDTPAYARLQQSLESLGIPAYCLPGNHDTVAIMAGELRGCAMLWGSCIQMGGWNFVPLNSAIAGQVHGYLDIESLAWLDRQLSQHSDLPTLIALHHPAILLGCDWIDKSGLQDRDRFWQICDRHPQIKVIISGHAHQAFDSELDSELNLEQSDRTSRARYLVTPSTCAQFAPRTPKFELDRFNNPGFRLLRLYPNGAIETEVIRHARVGYVGAEQC